MKLAHLLLLPTLLLSGAGCQKKDDAAPVAPAVPATNPALLTTPTWRSQDARITLNGVEGVASNGAADFKFTPDGKYTATRTNNTNAFDNGTWAFSNNEAQLTLKSAGLSYNFTYTDYPYQLAPLSATDLSLYSGAFTQAQVQQALNSNNTAPTDTDKLIQGLVLSYTNYTYPGGSPPVSSSAQITSLSFRINLKVR